MTSPQSWLRKPRATVRIDTTVPWAAWMKLLRRQFSGGKAETGPRIEVLDRLSLGGKKSLLLISIEDRHMLVGIGEDAAPSIHNIESRRQIGTSRLSADCKTNALRSRKRVRG
jgi:flagellar biogenesis protein FliO